MMEMWKRKLGLLFVGLVAQGIFFTLDISWLQMLGYMAISGACFGIATYIFYTMSRDKEAELKHSLLERLGLSDENGFEQAIIDLKKMLDKTAKELKIMTYFRDILNTLPYPIIAVNDKEEIVVANLNARTFAPDGKAKGKTVYQLLGVEKSSVKPGCPIEATMSSKAMEMTEPFKLDWKGKEGVITRIDSVPLKNLNQQIYGYIVIVRDITVEENRKAETQRVIHDVAEVVSQVSEHTAHLSEQIMQIEQGAEQQASASNQTAAAIEESAATSRSVAENAANANNAANQAEDASKEGQQGVEKLKEQVSSLTENMDKIGQEVANMQENAVGAKAIMAVINDIADQTNLLALNAAIEAARAGDAGRGFAVVADEVRKLAEKTMNTTQEVEKAIEGLIANSKDVAGSVENGQEATSQVRDESEQVGENLLQITASVHDVTEQMANIAAATEQQSAAAEQIASGASETSVISEEQKNQVTSATETIEKIGPHMANLQDNMQTLDTH